MKEIEKYPHIFPPYDAVPFDINQSVSLAGNTPLKQLATIQRTTGYVGVIRYVELSSSDFGTTASPDSYFQFQMGGLQGGTPMTDYSKITQPMMATTPTLIFIGQNQAFSIWATNLTASFVALRFRLTGWYFVPPGGKS